MVRSVALTLVCLSACTDHEKKLKEKIEQREQAKKDLEKVAEAKRKAAIPVVEAAHLEPPWDDPKYQRVSTGKPCPEGLWALFPSTPGEGEEQKKNAARREELAKQVHEGTYITNLRLSGGVVVHPYNVKKKTVTIEVDGLVECTDGLGMVSLAWGEPAKPFRPPGGGGDDDEEALTPQSVWRARPLLFKLPFATKAEAAVFTEGPGTLLEARLVYTLGKPAEDKHLVKTSRLAQEDGTRSGQDAIDWGAGRLVHVELIGVRVATDHEKVAVVEKKYK
jgi:hypothetical protein